MQPVLSDRKHKSLNSKPVHTEINLKKRKTNMSTTHTKH